MITSVLNGGGTLVSTAPIVRTCPTKCRLRCYHHPNPREVGEPTHLINPVLVNPGYFQWRKSVKKAEEKAEEMGVKQMVSFCGLGYWVCGFRCFPWLALNIHMAHNLNMHPYTLQLVHSSANLPMVAKPPYGMLSDALYIGGAHLIPYVL